MYKWFPAHNCPWYVPYLDKSRLPRGHLHKCPCDYHSIHSNLPNVTSVTTKVHVILRRYVVLAWMCDNKELVGYYGIA